MVFWKPVDFLVVGILMLIFGFGSVFIAQKVKNKVSEMAFLLLLGAILNYIWIDKSSALMSEISERKRRGGGWFE